MINKLTIETELEDKISQSQTSFDQTDLKTILREVHFFL